MSATTIYEIIILGAGPAGISVAIEAMNRGVRPENILILEKSDEIIHMIKKKYPDEKPVLANYKGRSSNAVGQLSIGDMTKSEFVNMMNDIVIKSGIRIEFNQTATKVVKLRNEQLQVCTTNECFIGNSVFIAIGSMASPRKFSLPISQDASLRIFYDIQNVSSDMRQILVVGGGDSAAEYAMILLERGHTVALSYRGDNFNKMLESNSVALQKMIKAGKIDFYPKTEVSSIKSLEDNLELFLSDGTGPLNFDAIVGALGSERPTNYLNQIGIQLCYEGNEVYSEASLPGVFAVGDLASKNGGTINIAFSSGALALNKACHLFLDCKKS